ncbi:Imm32 family immunity protein [Jannaschia ovalis]|uniref:Imm32 family immunity protein n=1 Tax=Jannaschia ovalis TaxID=3038773 RepID=A0ABY8L9F8_9RHOB|nr:Imm32 family immunity protein [Jannaschia sp. GRR-S6-38]WGH77995.1 Imm32 family immunity protein [Jannaschia sp. GRR-S6-38]
MAQQDEYVLTFEVGVGDQGHELHIHFDAVGLQKLRQALDHVERSKDHEHLMVPSWGGSELTEEKQNDSSHLIPSVTIHFWD